jgi:prephenate dehydrogenase
MQDLPARFDPVGGHPMCGKERSSLANADPAIFHGSTFAFVPLERSSAASRAFCHELAQAVGAAPLWLDAQTHDHWTAFTSHVPYLLSNALAAITPLEATALVGPGFRSTVRLAATPPPLMLDILFSNRDNVLATLRAFQSHLGHVERLLEAGDSEALENLLSSGMKRQKTLLGSSG